MNVMVCILIIGEEMEIKIFSTEYFEETFEVIHKTIEEIYPKYYPRKAVDFFHDHHSAENMKIKLPHEYVLIILENNKLIGTGALIKNDINRFFILPKYQNKGYGKKLLLKLENKVDRKLYNKTALASSLGAIHFYRKKWI
jgi:GNAT superfamily N-acetyltransferase